MESFTFGKTNECDSHEESFIPNVERPAVSLWCFRLVFYLFSIVFLSFSVLRDPEKLQQYSFSRERGVEKLEKDNTDAFALCVFAYSVWVCTILSEVLTLVSRGGKNPWNFISFHFDRVVSIHGDENGFRFMKGLLLMWFSGLAVCASFMLFTASEHVFEKLNQHFSWLFLIFTSFEAFAAVSDAVSLCGIDGLAVQNRAASWLSAFRIVVILPVTLMTFFVFLQHRNSNGLQ